MHNARQIALRNSAVFKNRVVSKSLGIPIGQAGEVFDQHAIRATVGLDAASRIVGSPFVSHLFNNPLALLLAWQRKVQRCCVRFKLAGYVDFVTEQNELATSIGLTHANVF